jgi:hypothetical protein
MQTNYSILSKEAFDNFLAKYKAKIDIIGRIFRSGIEFDPNFQTYFFQFERMAFEPFKVLPDKIDEKNKEPKRAKFMEQIKKSEPGKKYRIFGHSGIGKSTGLICALKYDLKPNVGSLYINLKSMRKLIEAKNFNKIRQIFIDEIIFLFHDNYDNYETLANSIKDFQFSSVWELIEFVLDKIKDMKVEKFIIVFDEYKKKNDQFDAYSQLCKKYLEGSKVLSFVRVSPQNDNPDIREDFIKAILNKDFTKNVTILSGFMLDFFS